MNRCWLNHLLAVGILCLGALLSSPMVRGQVVQAVHGSAVVDWTEQVIQLILTVQPEASAPANLQKARAIEQAKRRAVDRLYSAVLELNYSAEQTVGEAVAHHLLSGSRLQYVLRHLRVAKIGNLSTGEIEVTVQMPLYGPLADVLLPLQFGGGRLMLVTRPLCPLCGQPWPEGKPVPEGVHLIQPPGTDTTGVEYTGLIVDARGLGGNPAFVPKILDDEGREVYSPAFARRTYAVDLGLVLYENDLNRAMENERVGKQPLVVKALDVSGKLRTDPVISAQDALLIHAAAARRNFLERCRVVIVLGEE